MILDEAIKHYEETTKELEEEAVKGCCDDTEIMNKCIECANEHRQLAEWLKELKRLREEQKDVYTNGYDAGYDAGYNEGYEDAKELYS